MKASGMDPYREAINEGHRAVRAGKWLEAASAYRTAITAWPGDPTSRVSLALCLYQGGELAEAFREYESLLKLSPKDTQLLMRMSDIQHRLGKPETATELSLQAAEIYLQQKRQVKALQIWHWVADSYGDNLPCLDRLAKACVKAGDKQLAAEAHLALARAHAEVASQKQAVRACRTAVELDGANGSARHMLKSLENGTSEWRSLTFLRQFKLKAAVMEEGPSELNDLNSESIAAPAIANAHDRQQSTEHESWQEREPNAEPGRAAVEAAEAILAEAAKFQQMGDVVSALAVLCQPNESTCGIDDEAASALKQRITSLLAGWRLISIDDLASLPLENRKLVLKEMLAVDDYIGRNLKIAAMDACLTVIERMPSYLPAQMRLAEMQAAEGRVEAAGAKYSCVVQLYKMRGNYELAAEALRCLVDLYEDDDELRGKLANFLLEQGNLDAALDQMMRVVERHLAKNDGQNALRQFSKILQLAPNRVDTNLRFAEVAVQMGKMLEARNAYERALAVEPDNREINLRFTLHGALFEEWSSFEAHLDRFFQSLSSDHAFAAAVAEQFSKALVKRSDKRELKIGLGAALQAMGRLDDAAELLRGTIIGKSYIDRVASFYLASVLVEKGKPDEALECVGSDAPLVEGPLEIDIAGDERSAGSSSVWLDINLLRLLKRAYQGVGDRSALLAVLKRMKEIGPEEEIIYLDLADAYFGADQPGAAADELDQLAQLLMARGDRARALAVYEGILDRVPNDLAVMKNLAARFESLGLANRAAEQLDLVIEAELSGRMVSEAAEDLRRLIELYRTIDPGKALAARERLVMMMPGETSCREDLILAYLRMGLADRALAEVDALAKDLIARREHEDAIRALHQMLQLDPWDAWALEQLSNSLRVVGRDEESANVYRRLLSIDPQNSSARERVARNGG